FQKCRVRGYFQQSEVIQEVDSRLREVLAIDQGQDHNMPVWRMLADQDWQESWKEHFFPIPVGEKLLILPSWLSPPAGMESRLIIRLDPEMAFGSGQHETTQGCLAALDERSKEHPLGRVLDLGTGSGILSIAAMLLGASQVVATDMDPIAVETTRRNMASNMEGDISWQEKVTLLETQQVPQGSFDTILANILAPVLCDMAIDVARNLLPGGCAILAGLLNNQEEDVSSCYQQAGLTLCKKWQSGEWTIMQWEKDQP
ncbi:MAG: 50S ribosomal protein L11 methyltransferase, partial [Magnetococcales bacterium]|nr:50S ribosomal protein L11 methyltransferase [Magnetococcales bacterium]